MWKQVTSYLVVSSKNFVSIIYGQNPDTTKYFGITYSMKAGDSFGYKFTKKFIKTYGLP
jgi:hypothetical protein